MAYQPKTTSKFNRIKKKLPASLQKAIDQQVLLICQHPEAGEMKTGDLAGVRVHKFGHMGQLYLLAYEPDEQAQVITIYAVGGHENFYRDLKAYSKSGSSLFGVGKLARDTRVQAGSVPGCPLEPKTF